MSSRFAISGIAIGFAAAALLAACGGAGGTASGPGSLPAPGPGQAQKVLTVTLAIPGNTPQTAARKPQYVSPNTQSITIAVASVNGIAPVPQPTPTVFAIAAPACTTTAPITCTFPVDVPSATSVVLSISAFASTNGTGTPLSTGLTQSVNTTLANPIFRASLGGTPKSVIFTIGSSTTPVTAASMSTSFPLQLNVTALDASNAVIIGSTSSPPPYSSPITLTMTGDPSHDLNFSTATITAPGSVGGATTYSITYAPASIGTQLTSVTLVASIGSTSVGSLTINPLNLITSATGLTTLINGGAASSIAVQEYGNTAAFTFAGPGSFATVSCAPASCAPSTSGGIVTLTVAPATITGASGTGVLTISDATGMSLGVNVVVTGATSGGLTVPPTLPIREFVVPTTSSAPTGITVGPAGNNLWFTENTVGKVGKLFVKTCTTVSPYSCAIVDELLQGSVTANGIAAGSDGNMWVAVSGTLGTAGSIERVVTSSGCATSTSLTCAVSTPLPYLSTSAMTPEFTGLATGSDASLYYAYTDATGTYPSGVGAINAPIPSASTASLSVPLPTIAPTTQANPQAMAVGPNRNMWFTDSAAGGGIGTVTCAVNTCAATEYYGGLGIHGTYGIVAAPDGYLYVSEGPSNAIARILPANCTGVGALATCAVQQTISTSGSVYGLALGSDGNVWYADPIASVGKIGVVVLSTCATACTVHEYAIPSGKVAANLVRGPDGNIWFTEPSGNAIGEVVLH